MIAEGTITDIRQLVRAADATGFYDRILSVGPAYESARQLLEDADAIALSRFPDGTLRLRVEDLAYLLTKAPHQVLAFVQAMTETGSPQMLVMVWRLLRGMQIARMDVQYASSDSFRLVVTLAGPRGTGDETYESDDLFDFNLLRHVSLAKLNGRPVLDGFFPTSR